MAQKIEMKEKYLRRSDNLGFYAKLCGFVTGLHCFIISIIFLPKLIESGLFFEYLREAPPIFIICLLLGLIGFITTVTLLALSSHYNTKAEEDDRR